MLVQLFVSVLALLSTASADDAEAEAALAFLDHDPAEYAIEGACLSTHLRVRERVRLGDRVFDSRFAWADVTGRNTSVLVAFRDSCDAARFGVPPIPRCAPRAQTYNGEICVVDELYILPDEVAARALALRILVDEARTDGAALPSDNRAAAQSLIDAAGASR